MRAGSDRMLVEVRAVPPFEKNGFVVSCTRTRDAALIDPGDEVSELLHVVADQRLTVKFILLTHAHIDHVTGVAAARRALKAPVCLHRDDLFLYEEVSQQAAMFGLPVPSLPRIDHFYDLQEVLRVGELEVKVHHTPGHCPGGVCLQFGPAGQPGQDLFVGDTLFAGSIGRTDLPGGDYETLMNSIKNVLFPLGDEATVYPGHGPATTIGRERRTNPFCRL